MGIDCLDIVFQIEKRFGVRLSDDDFKSLFTAGTTDCTAGDVLFVIESKLREEERSVPISSWNRLRWVLAKALGVSPWKIRRESRLVGDLGCT